MKISEDRLDQVIGWSIIVGIGANLLLSLNLYRQMGDLEYKVHSLDGNINSAIQSLSRDVWEMKVKND